MCPTLTKARLLHRCNAIGTTADSIEWFRPGLLLADGERCWAIVVRLGPESPQPFDQLELAA